MVSRQTGRLNIARATLHYNYSSERLNEILKQRNSQAPAEATTV